MVAAIEEVNHATAGLHLCVSSSVNHDVRSKSIGSFQEMRVLKAQPANDRMGSIGENNIYQKTELEFVHTPDNNDTTMTMYCKESRVNSDNLASETQTALLKNGFTPDEDLSKDLIPFASSDDGASQNDLTFRVFSSSKRDFNYSSNSCKARIVGKSGSTGAYYEANKPHRSQDHQLTLPHPVDISKDSPIKELVTG